MLEHDNPCVVRRAPGPVARHTRVFLILVHAVPPSRAAPYCVGAALFLIRPDAHAVSIVSIITRYGSAYVPYCT